MSDSVMAAAFLCLTAFLSTMQTKMESVSSPEAHAENSTSETEVREDSKAVPVEPNSIIPDNTEVQERIASETETIMSTTPPEAEPALDAKSEQNGTSSAASSLQLDENEESFNRLAEAQQMLDSVFPQKTELYSVI